MFDDGLIGTLDDDDSNGLFDLPLFSPEFVVAHGDEHVDECLRLPTSALGFLGNDGIKKYDVNDDVSKLSKEKLDDLTRSAESVLVVETTEEQGRGIGDNEIDYRGPVSPFDAAWAEDVPHAASPVPTGAPEQVPESPEFGNSIPELSNLLGDSQDGSSGPYAQLFSAMNEWEHVDDDTPTLASHVRDKLAQAFADPTDRQVACDCVLDWFVFMRKVINATGVFNDEGGFCKVLCDALRGYETLSTDTPGHIISTPFVEDKLCLWFREAGHHTLSLAVHGPAGDMLFALIDTMLSPVWAAEALSNFAAAPGLILTLGRMLGDKLPHCARAIRRMTGFTNQCPATKSSWLLHLAFNTPKTFLPRSVAGPVPAVRAKVSEEVPAVAVALAGRTYANIVDAYEHILDVPLDKIRAVLDGYSQNMSRETLVTSTELSYEMVAALFDAIPDARQALEALPRGVRLHAVKKRILPHVQRVTTAVSWDVIDDCKADEMRLECSVELRAQLDAALATNYMAFRVPYIGVGALRTELNTVWAVVNIHNYELRYVQVGKWAVCGFPAHLASAFKLVAAQSALAAHLCNSARFVSPAVLGARGVMQHVVDAARPLSEALAEATKTACISVAAAGAIALHAPTIKASISPQADSASSFVDIGRCLTFVLNFIKTIAEFSADGLRQLWNDEISANQPGQIQRLSEVLVTPYLLAKNHSGLKFLTNRATFKVDSTYIRGILGVVRRAAEGAIGSDELRLTKAIELFGAIAEGRETGTIMLKNLPMFENPQPARRGAKRQAMAGPTLGETLAAVHMLAYRDDTSTDERFALLFGLRPHLESGFFASTYRHNTNLAGTTQGGISTAPQQRPKDKVFASAKTIGAMVSGKAVPGVSPTEIVQMARTTTVTMCKEKMRSKGEAPVPYAALCGKAWQFYPARTTAGPLFLNNPATSIDGCASEKFFTTLFCVVEAWHSHCCRSGGLCAHAEYLRVSPASLDETPCCCRDGRDATIMNFGETLFFRRGHINSAGYDCSTAPTTLASPLY